MKKPCKELKKFEQLVYCCPINLYIFWLVVCHILWSIEHTLIDGYKIRLHTNFKVTIYPKLAMIISYNTMIDHRIPVYIFPYICIGNCWRLIFKDTYQIWTEVFFPFSSSVKYILKHVYKRFYKSFQSAFGVIGLNHFSFFFF